MTDISYVNLHKLSDEAIEKQIGQSIKRERQKQNKTQKELALQANISRSTLSLLERGESGSINTLIQVLRMLNRLDMMEVFIYKEVMSPLALAKATIKPAKRVRKTKQASNNDSTKKSDW